MRELRLTWLGRCAREPELDRESRGRACALGPELGTCEVEALARIGRPLGCCGERGPRVSRPSPGHIISLANHRHLPSHRPHILNDMSGEDLPNTDIITLTRYVLRILHRHPRKSPCAHRPRTRDPASHVLSDQFSLGAAATGDLTLLLTAIQTTSKFIATNVRKARLINL